MHKKISVLLSFFFILSTLLAQDNKPVIYKAFTSGDMDLWKKTMTNLESNKSANFSDKLDLVRYYYGYIGYSIGKGNKKEASNYVDKGEKLLTELDTSKPQNADVLALKAAFIGFKIGISPIKAPFIGKSSIDNAKKAIEADANNIQANIEQGNILYYSPSAFGGDKTQAKTYYKKAVSLMEKDPNEIQENWLYLSLLTQMAQIETSEKNYKEAKNLYNKILSIEPNYGYVKNELLPALLKKM